MSDLPIDDPVMLRHIRDLCPKKGQGNVTFTFRGKSVTLTPETRERINRRIQAAKAGAK